MNAIVDTNVVAYYLLGTEPFSEECKDFWRRARQTAAPGLWRAEVANVLWMAVRTKVISSEESFEKLRLAAGLRIRSTPIHHLWHGALIRSIQSGVPAYDTLFVELAARRKLHLATFDVQLLRTFPDIAKRPSVL
jgi:predicted nucleic acid-binding protein